MKVPSAKPELPADICAKNQLWAPYTMFFGSATHILFKAGLRKTTPKFSAQKLNINHKS
jgi:hypothetical protein